MNSKKAPDVHPVLRINSRCIGNSKLETRNSKLVSAFTLTELLVVIGIIVLLLALAVPALKVLGGGRDIASAENQIAAILGRARAQAISDRTVAGVMFFLDPKDSRVKAVLVEQTPATILTSTGGISVSPPAGTISLDMATDVLPTGMVTNGNAVADIFLLPQGIGIQFLDDCFVDTTVTPPRRHDDGYLGFNTRNQYTTGSPRTVSTQIPGVKYGGVILFDAGGKLIGDPYVFDAVEPDPTITGQTDFTMLGQLLFGAGQYDHPGTSNYATITFGNSKFVTPTPTDNPRVSQYGVIVFDRDAFIAKNFTDEDAEVEAPLAAGMTAAVAEAAINGYYDSTWPSVAGATWNPGAPAEILEENWLDQNSTPLIIDRYNGSLIRGE